MDKWYSAGLKYGMFVEDRGLVSWERTVIVFRAQDIESAATRALELGRSVEHQFFNQHGRLTKKRLVAVLTLDWVGDGDIDGLEVHSQMNDIASDEWLAFDHQLHPEDSHPDTTGVGVIRRTDAQN